MKTKQTFLLKWNFLHYILHNLLFMIWAKLQIINNWLILFVPFELWSSVGNNWLVRLKIEWCCINKKKESMDVIEIFFKSMNFFHKYKQFQFHRDLVTWLKWLISLLHQFLNAVEVQGLCMKITVSQRKT